MAYLLRLPKASLGLTGLGGACSSVLAENALLTPSAPATSGDAASCGAKLSSLQSSLSLMPSFACRTWSGQKKFCTLPTLPRPLVPLCFFLVDSCVPELCVLRTVLSCVCC